MLSLQTFSTAKGAIKRDDILRRGKNIKNIISNIQSVPNIMALVPSSYNYLYGDTLGDKVRG